jgi:signal peptidase II
MFAISLLVVAADQLSKFWIRSNMELYQYWPADGFFRLHYVQNTGAAFSIFDGNNEILTVIAFTGIILLLVYYFYIRSRYPFLNTRLNTVTLGLILGGVIGDLADRIYLGHVTDFISIGPWAIFNIADSAIVAGAIGFALSVLLSSRKLSLENQH